MAKSKRNSGTTVRPTGGKKPKNGKPSAFKHEIVRIADLKPHPRNYRDHPEDQLAHIAQSIREHGFYRNIVVARDGTILAGHGVVEAVRTMELEEVPVIRLPIAPDSARALKVLTGDNEIGNLVGVNDRTLSELLRQIQVEDPKGLLGTGFDDKQLAALVYITRPETEMPDQNAAAHWAGMPGYDAGSNMPKLVICFQNEEQRVKWCEEHDVCVVKKESKTWSAHYPPVDRADISSVKFEEAEA